MTIQIFVQIVLFILTACLIPLIIRVIKAEIEKNIAPLNVSLKSATEGLEEIKKKFDEYSSKNDNQHREFYSVKDSVIRIEAIQDRCKICQGDE